MKPVLKLFMLRYGRGGKVVKGEDGEPLFFHDKRLAKEARKEGQVVSFGIDHRKYKPRIGDV